MALPGETCLQPNEIHPIAALPPDGCQPDDVVYGPAEQARTKS